MSVNVELPSRLQAGQSSGVHENQPIARKSILGMPSFEWSLVLIGLCVFTFVIVTYSVNLAAVGIAIGGIGLVIGKGRVRVPFPLWLYAGFLLWAFIASFASPYPEIVREQLVDRLKLLMIMFITVNALRTDGQLRFYLLFFLVCFIVFPVRGALFNYFFYDYNISGRVVWNYTYGNTNELAALSLIALGIALSIRMSEPKRTLVRFGADISFILLLMIILMTQSRGAFLGLGIVILRLLIKMFKRMPRRAIGMAGVILFVAFYVPEAAWDRLSGIKQLTSVSTIHEADAEGSASERFEILNVAWRIFRDHPVFGVGLGVYKRANASYAPHLGFMDSHNTYLGLAAEVGLPGVILWCALVGSVLRYGGRRQRHSVKREAAEQQSWIWWGLIGYLVAGMFYSIGGLTFPYLMLAVLWCSGKLLSVSEASSGWKSA
jgi:O-antigen ligase